MDIEPFLKRTRLKQKELADLLGISKPMITAMKQGRSEPTYASCRKLLLAGMSIEELFGPDVWDAVKRSFPPDGLSLTDAECRRIVERGLSILQAEKALENNGDG